MSAAGMNAPVVDLDHLARYTGGDPALDAEVLQLFLDQSTTLMRQLRGVLDTRDQKNWREIVHGLKGAARGIGASPLADAAEAAEFLPVADNPDDAVAALQTLTARLDDAHRFIEAHLGT